MNPRVDPARSRGAASPAFMTQNPLGALLPHPSEEDRSLLAQSIIDHGLREPIVTYRGTVLDGWTRYGICIEFGIPYKSVEYTGASPNDYVWDKAQGRSWTPGQRAALKILIYSRDADGQVIAPPAPIEAPTPKTKEFKPVAAAAANSATVALPPNTTMEERALMNGVSRRTEATLEKVAKADPKLLEKVASATITLPEAERQVDAARGKVATPRPAPAPTPPVVVKQEHVVRLEARVSELTIERNALKIKLDEAVDANSDMVEMLLDLQAIKDGDFAKQLAALRQENKTAKAERDTARATNNQLVKDLTAAQRKLGQKLPGKK